MKYKSSIIKSVVLCAILAVANIVIPYNTKVVATVPYINERVSTDSSGTQANHDSTSMSSLSGDGRYVAFESYASNLVSGDNNGRIDIFVKDRDTGTTTRASVNSSGQECATPGSGGACWNISPRISYEGGHVAFISNSDNLTNPADSGGTSNSYDAFVRDLNGGTTETISVSTAGVKGNGHSVNDTVGISRDGRYVVFDSFSTNLVASDTNGENDIFVRDRTSSTTTRLSVDNTLAQANGSNYNPSISCDGSIVAFSSDATNLVSSDTNGVRDIFVVDRIGGHAITNITLAANAGSFKPSVSCDGTTVSFVSSASNLIGSDSNGFDDVFVYDISTATFELVSQSTAGTQGSTHSGSNGSSTAISGDGRYVTFASPATNLVASDTNAKDDVFLRDRVTNTTQMLSKRDASTQSNVHSYPPMSISANGEFVSFSSADTAMVPSDTNAKYDVFVVKTGATPCTL